MHYQRWTGRETAAVNGHICKFVINECCKVDGKFFNAENELGADPKFERLRN